MLGDCGEIYYIQNVIHIYQMKALTILNGTVWNALWSVFFYFFKCRWIMCRSWLKNKRLVHYYLKTSHVLSSFSLHAIDTLKSDIICFKCIFAFIYSLSTKLSPCTLQIFNQWNSYQNEKMSSYFMRSLKDSVKKFGNSKIYLFIWINIKIN